MEKEKDLCKTCEHYWQDFPMPLDRYISHCEILDRKNGMSDDMDSIVEECVTESNVLKNLLNPKSLG